MSCSRRRRAGGRQLMTKAALVFRGNLAVNVSSEPDRLWPWARAAADLMSCYHGNLSDNIISGGLTGARSPTNIEPTLPPPPGSPVAHPKAPFQFLLL